MAGSAKAPTPWGAVIGAGLDRARARDAGLPLDDVDLRGRTALVTGANRGLGLGIARVLAARGARVVMACRSGIPDAGEAIRRAHGPDSVEMRQVDLADLASVHALCDALHADGRRFDLVVTNAAVVPRALRRTAQGLELGFGVTYLAHALLIGRLLADGTLPRGAPSTGPAPRVVAIGSELHRQGELDPSALGYLEPFGPLGALRQYAKSKLLVTVFAMELSRRLAPGGQPEVAVHALCPGAVRSDLAREAPGWLAPLLSPTMRLFFQAPERAAEPAVYLAGAPALEGRTGVYLHMHAEKEPAPAARDPETGRRLFEATGALLRERNPAGRPVPDIFTLRR